MTRRQRWGLAALLGEVLILQVAFVDVLRFYTPVHVPRPAAILLLLLAGIGVWALVSGGED
jgi:hypothetical protein